MQRSFLLLLTLAVAFSQQRVVVEEREVLEAIGGQVVDARSSINSANGYPSSQTTYTIITPSPSASPVAITAISQVVTTFKPLMTLCGMALVPVESIDSNDMANSASHFSGDSSSSPLARYLNSSAPVPWGSRSASYSVTESCSVSRTPTMTTVCATNITGIATTVQITACDQDVTFSTATGYYLSSAASSNSNPYHWSSSANASQMSQSSNISSTSQVWNNTASQTQISQPNYPTIQTLTTFYIAPWQDVTSGMVPEDITARICSHPDGIATLSQCIDVHENMYVVPVTHTSTKTTTVDLTTTIHGPSQVIVEGYTADVTEKFTTFSLSTRIITVYSVETISTQITPNGLQSVSAEGRTTSSSSATRTQTGADALSTSSTTRTVYRNIPAATTSIKTRVHTFTVHPLPSSSSFAPNVVGSATESIAQDTSTSNGPDTTSDAIPTSEQESTASDISDSPPPSQQVATVPSDHRVDDESSSDTPSTTTQYTTVTSTYYTTTTISSEDASGGTVLVTAMTTVASTLVTSVDFASS